MWFVLASLGIISILICKLFLSGSKGYWKKYGIREIDASGVVSTLDIYLGKKDSSERDDYAYQVMGDDKFVGMIDGSFKTILVKDLDLIKKILIKDFDHFVDIRDFMEGARADNLLKIMLPTLTGDKWKHMRNVLTPAFSTGKIRRMMEYFNNVGNEWVKAIKQAAGQDGSTKIDVESTVNHYTVDVIASVVYGVNAGTCADPNSQFAKMAARLADVNWVKVMVSIYFPSVFKFFNIEIMDMQAINYFEQLSIHALEQRRTGQVHRNDFMQLLLEAQKGEDGKQLFSDRMLHAQTVMFFFAGIATIKQLISFVFYGLAAHPDMQEKIRREIDGVMKPDGTIEYDDLAGLTYMDMFISETLRKYPAALRTERICTKEYYDPETGLKCPKGTLIAIPLNALQFDERYFPNPDEFDPERFNPKHRGERNPYVYMPFGNGPRGCIGMRFALMKAKAAIAHMVRNFVIEPTPTTPLPVQGYKSGLQLFPPKGLELKLVPRKF